MIFGGRRLSKGSHKMFAPSDELGCGDAEGNGRARRLWFSFEQSQMNCSGLV